MTNTTTQSSKPKSPAIGIDLGTTYSCVAVWDENVDNVVIIPNDQGARTTPSYVAFNDDGRLVGIAAKNQAALNPENTVYDAKRLIGRNWNDPVVQSDSKLWPFKVNNGNGNNPMIQVTTNDGQKSFKPEEISAYVLSEMKRIAANYLGISAENVMNAVVTVPAYFNDSQRQATKDAGTIAGLNVMRIINEPTAAAIAYGLDKKTDKTQRILIFDLGGGTFDVSLLDVENGVFEVRATAGDTHLGGEDFDNHMLQYCMAEFRKRHKKDMSSNSRSVRRLKTVCERAKQTLSTAHVATVEVDSLFEGIDFNFDITRAQFEHMNRELFQKCLEPVDKVLKDAKVSKADVDEIVFVGGSTRIPYIEKMVKEYFNGKVPNRSINPDEAVAYGAAVQAYALNGGTSKKMTDLLLIDVTPLTLGLDTAGGITAKLIPRNTTIPCKKSQVFSTATDNQTGVTVQVCQGERAMTRDNIMLGSFHHNDIPPQLRGKPQIEITFDLDANGILNVTAKDLGTGKDSKMTITHDKTRLSQGEIDRMVNTAKQFEKEDEQNQRRIETHNKSQSLIRSIEQTLTDSKMKDKLPTDSTQTVLTKCKEMSAWLDQNENASAEEIEAKQKELEALYYPLMEAVYKSQGMSEPEAQEQAQNQGTTQSGGSGGCTVEEVD